MLGWYAAITAVLTWPLPISLSRRILGDELAGPWRTLWGYNWTFTRLLRDGRWPLDAPEIAYPAGGPFSSIAPVNDFVSLILQPIVGLVPAFNLIGLGFILLAATGGYALARAMRIGRDGALVVGTVFGFNSFFLTYSITSCVIETTGQAWIPWFLAAVVQMLRKPGPGIAVAAGVLYAVTGLSSFYWALFVAMFSPFVALGVLLDRRAEAQPLITWPMVKWTLVSLVIAGVLFGVPAAALLETYKAKGAVLEGYDLAKQKLLSPSLLASHVHDLATLGGYFLPGKGQLAAHEDMDRLAASTYAGWVALALAGGAVGRGRWRWFGVALAGLLLSMGPFLFVAEGSYQSSPVWWWHALRELLPPVRQVTSYIRFSVFFFIGLAMLAGAETERIAAALRRRAGAWAGRAPWVGLGFSALVVAELIVLSPVPFPLPTAEATISEASLALADMPQQGAVLDWPQRYAGKKVEVSRYFYYQSVHGRPIPYDFAPTNYRPGPIEGNPFFGALEVVTYGSDYYSGAWSELTSLPVTRGVDDIRAMGFSYLVLHPEHLDPARKAAVIAWLDHYLSRLKTFEDGSIIYQLSS